MEEAKELKIENGRFEANGNTYKVVQSLPLARWRVLEKLRRDVAWDVDPESTLKKHREIWDKLNVGKHNEAIVLLHNLMNAEVKHIKGYEHPALLLLTLFFNREGEDVTVWDDELAKDKVNDWAKEGYDSRDFFSIANALLDDSQTSSGSDSATGSMETEQKT